LGLFWSIAGASWIARLRRHERHRATAARAASLLKVASMDSGASDQSRGGRFPVRFAPLRVEVAGCRISTRVYS
jgi:hypothetical protein